MTSSFYKQKLLKKGPKRQARWRNLAKKTFRFFIAAIFFAVAGVLLLFIYYAKDLPDPQKVNERQIAESTKIYDRTGQILLYDIHGEEKRTMIPSEQMSPFIKKATVAIEDENFYKHFGLDFKAILRALIYDILGRNASQGGSTISQQFIKKALLTDEKKISRKIKEAVLALELERRYSKEEILSFYLNQIPYGSNAYGIEAAAQTFFGKSAKDLTLAESAVLAALPNAPSRLSPYGSHPEELTARKEKVLNKMVQLGYIESAEAEAAKKEPVSFMPQAHTIKAPHFVMYIKEYLEDKYGADYIEKAGLKVYTTLDWDLQKAAEEIIYEGALSNRKKYNANNAALTAIDPKNGQILVLVGSADFFATSSLPLGCTPGKNCRFEPSVNVAVRDRQPGSSFKPFAYVTAFEKGFTDATVLFDLPTEFNEYCSASANQDKDKYGLDCYHPNNYDEKFRGPTTARAALAQSLNIPAVQMLYLAGINDTIKTAQDMGFTTLNDSYYGLSLVLGGGEVKLLDEVAAYSVFANDGVRHEKTAILKIIDSQGKIIEEFESRPKKVLEPQFARMISSILSDNESRTPVFGANSSLYFAGRPVAAKTGTTQKYRDAWTLGYTPSLAAGIWVGNNDNTPMSKAGAGISAAGPLWHAFFEKAYQLKNKDCQSSSFCLPAEPEQFMAPEQIITKKPMLNGSFLSEKIVKVDKISGQIATDQTPPELIEEKSFIQIHNILYYAKKDDPQGETPNNPEADPLFENWETPVLNWASQNNYANNLPLEPSGYDPIHTGANLPKIKISFPQDNQIISQSPFLLQVETSAVFGVKQVDYFLNEDFIGSAVAPPYQISANIPAALLNGPPNNLILKAVVYDNVFNRSEDKITIRAGR